MTVWLTACSVFGMRSGTEQSSYTVIDRLGDSTEVRGYPVKLVAEAEVTAPDEASGRNQAFRLLFDYISGANRAQTKVAMTTPVETAPRAAKIAMTVPVETETKAPGRYMMRFFLPASYTLETVPEPTDPRVRIGEVTERTLAVLRFSGSTSAENVARYTGDLQTSIDASGWRTVGEPTAMFYDPPWTIPALRRNEVAVPVTNR
jgi:hypothetical protein